MARPRGIDHFLGYLAGLEHQYVVIGGGAATLLMEEQSLEFRAAKLEERQLIFRVRRRNRFHRR